MIYQVKVNRLESKALQNAALAVGYGWRDCPQSNYVMNIHSSNNEFAYLYFHIFSSGNYKATHFITSSDKYIYDCKYTDVVPSEMFSILTKEQEKPIMVGPYKVEFGVYTVKIGRIILDHDKIRNIYLKCYPISTTIPQMNLREHVILSYGHVSNVTFDMPGEPTIDIDVETVKKIYQKIHKSNE